jgi:hypothetical protein
MKTDEFYVVRAEADTLSFKVGLAHGDRNSTISHGYNI